MPISSHSSLTWTATCDDCFLWMKRENWVDSHGEWGTPPFPRVLSAYFVRIIINEGRLDRNWREGERERDSKRMCNVSYRILYRSVSRLCSPREKKGHRSESKTSLSSLSLSLFVSSNFSIESPSFFFYFLPWCIITQRENKNIALSLTLPHFFTLFTTTTLNHYISLSLSLSNLKDLYLLKRKMFFILSQQFGEKKLLQRRQVTPLDHHYTQIMYNWQKRI